MSGSEGDRPARTPGRRQPGHEPTSVEGEPGARDQESLDAGAGDKPTALTGRRLAVVGTTLFTAVVGAVAAAIISPDRLDRLFGNEPQSDSDTAGASASATAEPTTFRVVSSPNNEVTIRAPASWVAVQSAYDTPWAGVQSKTGIGLRVSDSALANSALYAASEVYVGATAADVSLLGVEGMETAELQSYLQSVASEIDWSSDGCSPTEADLSFGAAWVGAAQAWDGCLGVDGMRVWDVRLVSGDRSAAVVLQIVLLPEVSDDVLNEIVPSVHVDASKLPHGPSSSDLVGP